MFNNSPQLLAARLLQSPPLSEPMGNQSSVYLALFLNSPSFRTKELEESTFGVGLWMTRPNVERGLTRVKIYVVACACISVHSGIQKKIFRWSQNVTQVHKSISIVTIEWVLHMCILKLYSFATYSGASPYCLALCIDGCEVGRPDL